MYLLSSKALRHVLLISTVRRTWFLDWKVRKVLGVDLWCFEDGEKLVVENLLLYIGFFIPLALIFDSLGLCGTNKEYIVALRPTNSRGVIDPVSLLNLPYTRWFLVVYSGSVVSKLLVSNKSTFCDMSLYKSGVSMWQQKESVNNNLQRSEYLGFK